MTRWTPTARKELADKGPVELRTLIAAALDTIERALPLLAELTDSRQPGLPVTTRDTLKTAGQLRARELAARYPSRRADGSLIAVGQRGLVRSDLVVTMPGERPVPVNQAATSIADEIALDLLLLNRRIHRQLAAAGVCHIRRPLEPPAAVQARVSVARPRPALVLGETRRLVDVVASPTLLLEVARTVEDLADRASTIALGPDRVPHPRPCPHCHRLSLVVHLDAGVTRCEGTHRCKCTDSYCACQRNRGHRHEWLRSAPDKASRKGWRSRKESWDGLTREQDLVDRENAAADTDTTEGAPTVTTTAIEDQPRGHVLTITAGPDSDDFAYQVECLNPAKCGGWQECLEPHEVGGKSAADDPYDCELADPWADEEEFEFHGVVHTWRYSWGWTVPFEGCVVAANDAPAEAAHDIGTTRGPGRYEVEDDWDDTSCYLEVIEPAETTGADA